MIVIEMENGKKIKVLTIVNNLWEFIEPTIRFQNLMRGQSNIINV
mgnify:CR=1 FL=1